MFCKKYTIFVHHPRPINIFTIIHKIDVRLHTNCSLFSGYMVLPHCLTFTFPTQLVGLLMSVSTWNESKNKIKLNLCTGQSIWKNYKCHLFCAVLYLDEMNAANTVRWFSYLRPAACLSPPFLTSTPSSLPLTPNRLFESCWLWAWYPPSQATAQLSLHPASCSLPSLCNCQELF